MIGILVMILVLLRDAFALYPVIGIKFVLDWLFCPRNEPVAFWDLLVGNVRLFDSLDCTFTTLYVSVVIYAVTLGLVLDHLIFKKWVSSLSIFKVQHTKMSH